MSKYKIENRDEIISLYEDANMILYGNKNPYTIENVNALRQEGRLYFETDDGDVELAAEKYLKASSLLLDSLEKEGITKQKDIRDKKIMDIIENLVFDTTERLEEVKKYDESIAISQRYLGIEWTITDERKALRPYKKMLVRDHKHLSEQTIDKMLDAYEAESIMSTSLKRVIADCYGEKGDVEKACELYEGYIQDDPVDGEYYLNYLLMLDLTSSPLLAEKITWICQCLKVNPTLIELDSVKTILDLARKCEKKEEISYLESEMDKMLKSQQQALQMQKKNIDQKVPVQKLGKYLPKKKQKELKKKGLLK